MKDFINFIGFTVVILIGVTLVAATMYKDIWIWGQILK